MELKELTDLISIRQYIVSSMGNPVFDRQTVTEMNNILLLIDKKIVSILKGSEFKEYIGYADVRKAIEDAARITNIKSGLKR